MALRSLLNLDDIGSPVFASYLAIEDLLGLSQSSRDCLRLCRRALRVLHLQDFGDQAAATLLRLVGSSLTDKGADIREIDASFCRSVTNDTLKALPKLPAVVALNLDGCQDVDDEGLVAVAQRCTGLRRFSVYWNVKATDKGYGRVLRAQPCGNLQELCFSGCKFLSNETVQRVVGRGPQLQILDLTRCPQVTDSSIQMVCECLPNLRVFRLYAMAQLSGKAFTALAGLPLLEELDLCGCRVEDPAIEEFLSAASPSPLHTLNLTWCPALTDRSMLAVAQCCPRVSWLSFFGNTNMTSSAVEALASSACGRSLRFLDIRGLTQAAQYSADSQSVRRLFPSVVETELHH